MNGVTCKHVLGLGTVSEGEMKLLDHLTEPDPNSPGMLCLYCQRWESDDGGKYIKPWSHKLSDCPSFQRSPQRPRCRERAGAAQFLLAAPCTAHISRSRFAPSTNSGSPPPQHHSSTPQKVASRFHRQFSSSRPRSVIWPPLPVVWLQPPK